MPIYNNPPSVDANTGRIPEYKQVMQQDTDTSSPTYGQYVLKYEYTIGSTGTSNSLLTQAKTEYDQYGDGTGDGTDDGTDDDDGTSGGSNDSNSTAMIGNADGGGRRDTAAFDAFDASTASLDNLNNTINPSAFETAIMTGLSIVAPSALSALLNAGTAYNKGEAIKEINSRVENNTLGIDPTTGNLATDASILGLANMALDNTYGLFNNVTLTDAAKKKLEAAKVIGMNPLDDNSTGLATTMGYTAAEIDAMFDNFLEDESSYNEIGVTESVDSTENDGTATTTVTGVNGYGWSSVNGSTMTSSSTSTNTDGTTSINESGLTTANNVVSEGTGGTSGYSEGDVSNAQSTIDGAVNSGGNAYGMDNGVSAVGWGATTDNEGNTSYGGTVTYGGYNPGSGATTTGGNVTTGGPNTGGALSNPDGAYGNSNNSGGNSECFLAGTLITMADETKKPIEEIDLMEKVAVGGYVGGVGKFMAEDIYDYHNVKVSGTHLVNENDKWIRVRESKYAKPLDMGTQTVYALGTEHRRLLINKILFTDYLETKEQELFIDKGSVYFFNNREKISNKIAQENIDTLNAEN